MGESYKIVAPPDPASGRRKWLWLIALGVLALVATGVSFGPGLYRSALLAREGPGNGPLLVKRPDGKIELQVPPAQVFIGKPYKWRKLGEVITNVMEQYCVGDFDGDGNQDFLYWSSDQNAVLFKADGTALKPGLGRLVLPIPNKVFDWNGDGIDEIVMTRHQVPDSSWPRGKMPRSYDEFYGNIFLSVQGAIIGKCEHNYFDFGQLGRFSTGDGHEIAVSVLNNSLIFTEEYGQQLTDHPEYYLYGVKAQQSGTFKQVSFDCQDFFATDVDNDGRDEMLTMDKKGNLWECKFSADPQLLTGWPVLTAPTVAGDVDRLSGAEIVSIRPNPNTRGNSMAWVLGCDEDDPVRQNEKKMDEAVADAVQARLTAAGIEQPDWEYENSPSVSLDSRLKSMNKKLEQYDSQFILPDNIDWISVGQLIAWEYARPVGFIYSPHSHRCQRLQFPNYLRWSNTWMDFPFSKNSAVVCAAPGAKANVVYCIPSVGTGLLGFDAQGKCIYYEEFGTGVSNLYTLKTRDGDYLVLRVGNELRIYP